MRIGVLIDGGCLARWQLNALRSIADRNSFLILDCTNHRSTRRLAAHALYYALNLFTIRNRQTRHEPLPAGLPIASVVQFAAEMDGTWQKLPDQLLARMAADPPDVIVKFGMGLLRIPTEDRLGCPILSYHHGDPRRFRGRPAGFYELLGGEHEIGQIVQILSNHLDAGVVVAYGETKAHPHSYRKTLIDAYRRSPLLLCGAIANALAGRTIPIEPNGRNHRLPGNWLVIRFVLRLARKKLKRGLYGALVEKGWQVARAAVDAGWSPAGASELDDERCWRTLTRPRRYQFLADPFFDPSTGNVLAEAMRADGRGEIALILGDETRRLPMGEGHLSYPAAVALDGHTYVVPETAGWSAPRLLELQGEQVTDLGELNVEGRPRLLDPTPHGEGDLVFLFGNKVEEGDGVLRLWVARSLTERFTEHPASPVLISPGGARMGGLLFRRDAQLFRLGQDLRRSYGDGLVIFRIEELSAAAYREVQCGGIRFTRHRGPHTLNFRGNTALFDYYDDRFSPLAGIRRLRQVLASRWPRSRG